MSEPEAHASNEQGAEQPSNQGRWRAGYHRFHGQVDHHLNSSRGWILRPLVFVLGLAVVLLGIALLVLPGPGWVLIFAGLAILALVFPPAERLLDWLKAKFDSAKEKALRSTNRQESD